MIPIQPRVEATRPSSNHRTGSPFPLHAGTTGAAATIRNLNLPLNLIATPAHPRTASSGPAAATPRRAHRTRPARPEPEPPQGVPLKSGGTGRNRTTCFHPRGGRHTGPCGIVCPSSSAARARTAAPVSQDPVLRSVTADVPRGPAHTAVPAANPASGPGPDCTGQHLPNVVIKGDSLPTDGPVGQSRVPPTPTGIPRRPSLQGRIPPFRPLYRPKLIRS